jgi:hypothetical protein
MKTTISTSSLVTVLVAALFVLLPATSVAAVAVTSSTKTTAGSNTQATDAARVTIIITKGNQEITRRLTTLSAVATKITAATKLSTSDKASLNSEVSTTTNGLTTLKAQLDADTTLASARIDATSIYTEYRVYALLVPKIAFVKVADDQQVTESKLQAITPKLQTHITTAQQAGTDVTTMQAKLSDMTAHLTAAQTISSTIEANVIGLQPTDYDSNHAVLSGNKTQLTTAHSDLLTADADAKAIVSSLSLSASTKTTE